MCDRYTHAVITSIDIVCDRYTHAVNTSIGLQCVMLSLVQHGMLRWKHVSHSVEGHLTRRSLISEGNS